MLQSSDTLEAKMKAMKEKFKAQKSNMESSKSHMITQQAALMSIQEEEVDMQDLRKLSFVMGDDEVQTACVVYYCTEKGKVKG